MSHIRSAAPPVSLLGGWLPGLLLTVLLLAACSPALDWREFRADDGGFSVLLPQRPGQAEKKLATPVGEVTMRMYSVRVEETVLGAGYADFPAPPDAATQSAMQTALLKNLDGKIVSDQPVSIGSVNAQVASGAAAPVTLPAGAPLMGREVRKRGRLGQGSNTVDGELRARFFVSGKRYYQLVVIGRQGALPEADLDLFMTSFKPA